MFGSNSGKSSSFLGTGDSSSSSSSSILPTFQDEPACAKICPNMSYKHRIIGFIGCAACGYVLSFIGTLTLIGGMTQSNIRIFCVLYVLGNIIALGATGFLLGPRKQCIKMWDPSRRFTTAFYLSMLIVVFAVAVAKQNIFLVLFLLFVEILAACWYSLSYIPFGRKIVLGFFRKLGICFPCFYVSDAIQKARSGSSSSSSSSSSSASNSKGLSLGFRTSSTSK